MYAILFLVVSLFAALAGISGQASRAPQVTVAPASVAVRREETEPKVVLNTVREVSVSPVCNITMARLEAMTYGDHALQERLIDCASRRNPSAGRSFAVSKAEYDLWRDRR